MKSKDSTQNSILNHVLSHPHYGLAILNANNYTIEFENDCFTKCLPGEDRIDSRIPNLKLEKLSRAIQRKGKYFIEKEIKENKRSKVLKIEFTPSESNKLVVFMTDYSKEKETEYLLDSYIRIAEQNKRDLEASLELIKKQKEDLQTTNAALEREKNIVELRALQAVINPHFVSNSLSSIQGFIVDKNTDEAVNYLAHFGDLMRLSFEQSYFDYVSIEEILTLLKTYVAIEQMRMDHPWQFNLTVDENLNTSNSKIPPLLVQPFLENAIWHGINRKEGGGKISIDLKLIDQLTLKCTIEDNGFGRKRSAEVKPISKEKKSMGLHSLNVTNKRLDILWQEHKKKHKIAYTDLQDEEGNPCGTRVELFIPINF